MITDRNQTLDAIDRLCTLQEVVAATSLSRATIYREIASGHFPPPIKVGRLSRWRASDISTYLDALDELRDKPSAYDSEGSRVDA